MFSIYQNFGQQSFTNGEVRPYACAEVRPLWLCIYGGAEESWRRQTSQGARPVRICLWHGHIEAKGWGKNKCFFKKIFSFENINYLTGWNLKSSLPICGSEAIQTPSLGNPGSKSTLKILINLCDYIKVEVQKTEGPERRVYHQNLLTSRHSFHPKIYFKLLL